jgi:hypothetical protein
MGLKDELAQELDAARLGFHHLLDSVPEALYTQPSDNPAWTIGDVLYHITMGPPAIRIEIWMIRHAPWAFKALNNFTSGLFNRGNALFARHPKRITRQTLTNAYEKGQAGLISSLKRLREEDFRRSVVYPAEFVSELVGEVSIERLFRYIKVHFDVHAGQINAALLGSETTPEH